MAKAINIKDYPIEDIIISRVNTSAHGTTFSHSTKSRTPVLIDFGLMDTIFGGSQLLSPQGTAMGKPKIDLEVGLENDRTEHQKTVYKQVQKIRERIIECLSELEVKERLLDMNDQEYNKTGYERIVLDPLPVKRGSTKKENKKTGKEEFPVYGPKLKLTFQYARVKDGDRYIEDASKLKELYDSEKEQGKRGNHLFIDEQGKPLSVAVADINESIPKNSTLHVVASLAYTHISKMDKRGDRNGYITFTPLTIKRKEVRNTGMPFIETIFTEDSFNDEVLESTEGSFANIVEKASAATDANTTPAQPSKYVSDDEMSEQTEEEEEEEIEE